MLEGQVITGDSLSVTVTVNVLVDTFPDKSVAVIVTVVVPIAKLFPEAGFAVTVTPQLSVADGVNTTVAIFIPGFVLTVMLLIAAITGASLSFTVTVNEQVEVLPDASVAVVFTVVVPVGKKLPEAGLLVIVEEQLSVEFKLKFTIAPHCPGSLF